MTRTTPAPAALSAAIRGCRPIRTLALAGAVLSGAFASAGAHADVKVAFLGDQGGDHTVRQVLDLVREEGAELLVLQGDYAYDWGISSWIGHMEQALGPDFPVLGVVGNHEGSDWPIYRDWFARRIERVSGLSCSGDVGVKAHCTYRGISVVQVAPGVTEVPGVSPDDGYDDYIEDRFEDDPNVWRVCSFHKLMKRMQVGLKRDRTGWGVYEACRKRGAIVATAHSHTYSRTHLMRDFSEQSVGHTNDHLEVGPNRSFAFVSGLGGKSVRAQARGGDWFASIHTATQGATHGALFCDFGSTRASCEFKDVAGGVADRFTLETRNGGGDGSTRSSEPDDGGSDVDAPAGLEWRRYSSRSGSLSWQRPPTPGMRYEILRDGETVAMTTGLYQGTKGLSRERSYRFEVIAIAPDGARSAPSAVTASTGEGGSGVTSSGGGSGGASGDAPSGDVAPVSGLRASIYSSRMTELFWTRPSTFGMRYEIRRDGISVGTTDGTTYLDRTLSRGTDYRYEVIALDRNGGRAVPSAITVNTADR